MEITLLWRDSVLIRRELLVIDDAFTVEQFAVLNVSTLLHVIADPTPDVNT
jgi:hypothetical protein